MSNPSTPEKPESPSTEATPIFDTVASETGPVETIAGEDAAPPASARGHVSAAQAPERSADQASDATPPVPPALVEPKLSAPLSSPSTPSGLGSENPAAEPAAVASDAELEPLRAVESAQAPADPQAAAPSATHAATPVAPPWGSNASTSSANSAAPTPASPVEQGYPAAGFTPPAPHTVYVTAPTPPKRKNNRLAGVLYALLATVVFCVLFIGIAAIVLYQQYPADIGRFLPEFLRTLAFLVPSILFLVGFVILTLLANRAGWWAYVLGSFLVAAFVYFGTIGVVLLSRDVIAMTPREAAEAFSIVAVNQWVIIATIIAREVSIWFGAPIARRGRRLTEQNAEALASFERERASTVGEPYPAQH